MSFSTIFANVNSSVHHVPEGFNNLISRTIFAVVGCEESRRLGNLARLPEATDWHQRGQVVEQALLVLWRHQSGQARSVDWTRADGIHADLARLQVEQPGAREIAHGGLAGAVDAEVFGSLE